MWGRRVEIQAICLELVVTAKGVKTIGQPDLLRSLACDWLRDGWSPGLDKSRSEAHTIRPIKSC